MLESTGFGGGRINKTSSSYEVNYHLTDHLGSVRVVFRPTGSYPTIVERNDYLPFGGRWTSPYSASSTNRHRFSGKENQTVGDLPYQDFGARFYGGKLPILTTMDPLLEDRRGMTPFAYAANNPVRYIDWMGLSPQEPNRDYQNYQVQQQAEQEAAKKESEENIKTPTNKPAGVETQPIFPERARAKKDESAKDWGGVLAFVAVAVAVDGPAPIGDAVAGIALIGHAVFGGTRTMEAKSNASEYNRVGKGEMKRMQKNGFDPHEEKPSQGGPGGNIDVYENRNGDLFYKTQKGNHYEPMNINKFDYLPKR